MASGAVSAAVASDFGDSGAEADALITMTAKRAAWEDPEALAERLASNVAVQKHMFRSPITKAHLVASLVRTLLAVPGSVAASSVEIQVVKGHPTEGGHPTIALRIV